MLSGSTIRRKNSQQAMTQASLLDTTSNFLSRISDSHALTRIIGVSILSTMKSTSMSSTCSANENFKLAMPLVNFTSYCSPTPGNIGISVNSSSTDGMYSAGSRWSKSKILLDNDILGKLETATNTLSL